MWKFCKIRKIWIYKCAQFFQKLYENLEKFVTFYEIYGFYECYQALCELPQIMQIMWEAIHSHSHWEVEKSINFVMQFYKLVQNKEDLNLKVYKNLQTKFLQKYYKNFVICKIRKFCKEYQTLLKYYQTLHELHVFLLFDRN